MGSQQCSYLARYPISDGAAIRDLDALEEGVLGSSK